MHNASRLLGLLAYLVFASGPPPAAVELPGTLRDAFPVFGEPAVLTAQTMSLWNAWTGRAIGGSLRAAALPLLVHHPIRIDRIAVFDPDEPAHGERSR